MELESLIGKPGEKNFHYLPNEGNAGDGLIHYGLHRLADRLGLKMEAIRYPEERTGKDLLIVGAGGFCRNASHQMDPVRYYSSRFQNVYVLSATFETTYGPVNQMLRELPANVTIFCRERTSYDAALKLVPLPGNIHLDHDLAFQVDVSGHKKAGQGHLYAFRTDKESLLGRVPSPNFDISAMGREYHHTLILDALSNFESVDTDRLHICIAGALLGLKVRVFEGNYHKIRSIYDYSIRDRFPNVTLGGIDDLHLLLAASRKMEFRKRIHRFVRKLPKGEYLVSEVRRRRLLQGGK